MATSRYLTDRALDALADIATYSEQEFGKKAANRYINQFQMALDALQDNPGLLRSMPESSGRLQFYVVSKHLLVCDIFDDAIYILAIVHGSMDLPERIRDLEPQLIQEAEIMAKRISQK